MIHPTLQPLANLNLTEGAMQLMASLMASQLIDVQDVVFLADRFRRNAREMNGDAEIGINEVRVALKDVLDPVKHAKMMFLYRLASSYGNPDNVFKAFKDKDILDSKNGIMIFTGEDIEPYRGDLVRVFIKVVDYARGGDEIAKEMFVCMMEDLSGIPGLDFKNVLKGRIAEEISRDPGDMRRIKFYRIADANPQGFMDMVNQYFEDGNAENICRNLVL